MADQGSQGVLSPFLRKARINAVKTSLTGKILDVGCGSGALASIVPPDKYIGFDRDRGSLEIASRNFPKHRFVDQWPAEERFDSVAALAIIEHIAVPDYELLKWASALKGGGKIILTTPHKSFRMIHDLGAKLGIFSADAADEHEEMFTQESLRALSEKSGLTMTHYSRFLLGANQLCILQK